MCVPARWHRPAWAAIVMEKEEAMEFDTYTLVLSRRGPRALEFSEEELERLQAQHVAHLDALRERGVLLAGGPFRDQPDETPRGLGVLPPTSRRRGAWPSRTLRFRPADWRWT
jgi:hypothetical protein